MRRDADALQVLAYFASGGENDLDELRRVDKLGWEKLESLYHQLGEIVGLAYRK